MTAAAETEITRTLASYLVRLRYDDVPTEALESLKIFTLEAVGWSTPTRSR
jgi:hypothetical protein